MLVQAPCGSGKSTWISKLSIADRRKWLDGDTLLEDHKIKNRNYFWYQDDCADKREAIIKLFDEYRGRGFNIVYSGNPLIREMRTNLIVIPSAKIRRERLDRRTGFVPTFEQFDREEKAYAAASMDIKIIYGDLPTVEDIVSAMK